MQEGKVQRWRGDGIKVQYVHRVDLERVDYLYKKWWVEKKV